MDSDHYDVCYIIIDIMNVNDNDPVFRKPLYSVNVSEDGEELFTITHTVDP